MVHIYSNGLTAPCLMLPFARDWSGLPSVRYSRALKRHRAGRKLVTRKTAQQMNIPVLHRINGILHDLIAVTLTPLVRNTCSVI